jgi:hypothetical protein
MDFCTAGFLGLISIEIEIRTHYRVPLVAVQKTRRAMRWESKSTSFPQEVIKADAGTRGPIVQQG